MSRLILAALICLSTTLVHAQEVYVPDQFQGAYFCEDPGRVTCKRGREYVFITSFRLVYSDRICYIEQFEQLTSEKLHFIVKTSCPNQKGAPTEEWWNLSGRQIKLADGAEIWVDLRFKVFLGDETGGRTMRKISYYVPPPASTN